MKASGHPGDRAGHTGIYQAEAVTFRSSNGRAALVCGAGSSGIARQRAPFAGADQLWPGTSRGQSQHRRHNGGRLTVTGTAGPFGEMTRKGRMAADLGFSRD